MSDRIRMIKQARVFSRTLSRFGILSHNLKEDEFSPAGKLLDKTWGLLESKLYVERIYNRCLAPEQIYTQKTILIDDERNIEADVVCRNFQAGIMQLREGPPFAKLYIDHDLASYDENGKEQTGYHLMCWLEENIRYAPKEIICVSANPVGKAKIEQVIRNIYRRRNCG